MTREPARDLPQLAAACPACGACPGDLCTSHSGTRVRRTDVHQARRAAWEAARSAVAEELVIYRAEHDSIVLGLYTNREAARAHCEAYVRREEPDGSIRHLSWWTEDVADDEAVYELYITPAAVDSTARPTGYVVTPLGVAAAYDEEAEEW